MPQVATATIVYAMNGGRFKIVAGYGDSQIACLSGYLESSKSVLDAFVQNSIKNLKYIYFRNTPCEVIYDLAMETLLMEE